MAAVDGVNAMAEESSDKRTPLWVTAIPLWVATIAVAGTAVGAWFSRQSHQYDVDTKMIELSIGILRADVTEETKPLREWAIDVVDKRAGFQFNEAQRAALLKEPLPLDPGYTSYDYPASRPPSARH
jgi:hypothetical protein